MPCAKVVTIAAGTGSVMCTRLAWLARNTLLCLTALHIVTQLSSVVTFEAGFISKSSFSGSDQPNVSGSSINTCSALGQCVVTVQVSPLLAWLLNIVELGWCIHYIEHICRASRVVVNPSLHHRYCNFSGALLPL